MTLRIRPLRLPSLLRVVVPSLVVVPAIFAGTPDAAAPSRELVKEALHRELYGLQSERDALLAEASKLSPEYGPAHWHRGLVRERDKWQPVESLMHGDDSAGWAEYSERRDKAAGTVAGQQSLANWCRDRKLADQERAHLSRVLDLNPEHAEARNRLGFRNMDGLWVSRDELRQTEQRRELEAEAAARWRSAISEIRRGLQQADPERQRAARARLMQIDDSHALPLIESALSLTGEEGALAVIDVAGTMRDQEGTDSLIRHATLANQPLARKAAAERLRERPRECFVPAMLAEMYTLASSQFQIARLADGRLGYRHVLEREGRNERQVMQVDTIYSRTSRPNGDERDSLLRAFADSVRGAAQRDVAVVQRNFGQLALNDRLAAALNIATNQQLPADPKRWWQWWDEENDIVRLGEKQTRSRQEIRQVSMVDRRPQNGFQTSAPGRQGECFVAGTPVWTRRGLLNIEKIRVGDLVLSQNPHSGEVAFKPVLRTTIRPAGKLVKVTAGRDTFETSHGHLFWVVGNGWAKAQLLDSGMQLHCLTGTVPVDKLEDGTEAETYNLVVADFNAYFVGQQRVLSHDVTERRPTTSIVPGLARDE